MTAAEAQPRRPNILLVTLDQWRADHLGAAGCPLPITPNIDGLAAEGVTFMNHSAVTAPCGPSRTSMLTGRYLMGHRMVNNGTPLDAAVPNLANILRGAGYDPVLFGYTDTTLDPRLLDSTDSRRGSSEEPMPGFRAGAATGDDHGVKIPTDARPWLHWLGEHGLQFDDVWAAYGVDRYADPESALTLSPAPYPAELSPATFLTDHVIEYVKGRDEPWMVHLTYLQPHPPFSAPSPWFEAIDPSDVRPPNRRATPDEEATVHPLLGAFLSIPFLREPDDWSNAVWRSRYAAMVAEVDHQFGRLLDELRRTGTLDDTLVIVTSDHGEQLGDHWLRHKLGWFPESYRIPLVMRWKSEWAGRRIEHFTEHVDVLPTVAAAAGVATSDLPQGGVDGRSLLELLDGVAVSDWRDGAHWEWDFRDPVDQFPRRVAGLGLDECSLVVRDDGSWLTVTFSGSPTLPPLAYNLQDDPGCFVNRAGDRAVADRLLEQTRATLSWRLRNTRGPLVNMRTG